MFTVKATKLNLNVNVHLTVTEAGYDADHYWDYTLNKSRKSFKEKRLIELESFTTD